MGITRLPRHHVGRHRLVDAIRGAPVAVIEAGAGYGKTTLAAEMGRELEAITVWASLEVDDSQPERLVARLRRGARRAGLSELASQLEVPRPSEDLADAFLDGDAGDDRLLVVVDDAHVLGAEAVELVRLLAAGFPEEHTLLLLGRSISASIAEGPGVVRLRGSDLAFSTEEAARLCSLLGVEIDRHQAETLCQVTGGWAAALVLAAEEFRRSGNPAAELMALAARPGVLSQLLGRQLAALPPDVRSALSQLARLPIVDPAIATTATGIPHVVEQAIGAGIPFEPLADGRFHLPGPIREALAAAVLPDPAVARRAAAAYAEAGELRAALRTLIAANDQDRAAELLAQLPAARVERMDFGEMRALVDALAPDAVAGQPRVLLHLARACEAAAEARVREEALTRAAGLLGEEDDELRRELDAERARDLIRDGRVEEAAELARRLLEQAGRDELETRVRALHVLGRSHALRGDPDSLAGADALLEEAAALYDQLGNGSACAHALLGLAYDVYMVEGRFDEALTRLDQVLSRLAGRTRLRGIVLAFRAEALIELGRYDDAEASLAEAHALGAMLGDRRILGYTAWERARAASQRGNAAATVAELAEAERQEGDWFVHQTGAEFLADAVLLLDRCGEHDLASGYLERALARADDAETHTRLARAARLARSADPAEAERSLAQLEAEPGLRARERWRVALFRAWAARRQDDVGAAREHAARAFQAAAALGHPELPYVQEREIAETLAPEVGADLDLPVSIRLLGGFEVARAGRPVELPAGRGAQLVKLVASRGGRIASEEAIELLWPEVDPASGRQRLRIVLTRLRKVAGDLIVRDRDALALPPSAEVDGVVFEQAATGALEAGGDEAVAQARSALARYRGTVLPDDLYAPWAADVRERLTRRQLALLDLLARAARGRGDLDEATRFLEQAIEVDRFDEARYLDLARLFLDQGRRGRALGVLRSAAAALRELGLEPSTAHRELVRAAHA